MAKRMEFPSGMILLPGEHVIYYGRKSYWSDFWLILLGIILIAAFGVGLIILLIVFLRIHSTEYSLTNRRFYVKYGLISRRVHETWLENITDTNFFQSFLGRAFDFGTIVVNTAGSSSNPQFVYTGIKNPMKIVSYLRNAIEYRKSYSNYLRRLEKMEDEYFMGKITKKQYRVAKMRLAKKYGIRRPRKKKRKKRKKTVKKVRRKPKQPSEEDEEEDYAFEMP